MAKLCMGCMNPLSEGNMECKVCGFDITKDQNPEHCLPVATSLQGHYIVGRILGEFPDHLLYLAYDRQMKEPCFIQEFFPASLGRRDTIGGVQPMEGCDKAFEEYADSFRNTVRVLARMRELPAVAPVYDIFEENGTVYAVSDYCQGMTLTKKIKLSGGRIPWQEARGMFMPLLSSLAQLGEAGVYHLAICPDSIVIGSDGKARLRNFSVAAAHRAGTDLVPQFHPAYSAPEQYYPEEEVGAPADVYGMAATIFRTVTGAEPPAGDKRAKNSNDLFMPAEVAEELTQPVCVALFNALKVLPEQRTANLTQLHEQLSITPKVSALVDEANEDIAQADQEGLPPRQGSRTSLIVMLIISMVLLLASVGVIVSLVLGGKKNSNNGGSNTTVSNKEEKDEVPKVGEGEILVPNLVGEVYADLTEEDLAGLMIQVAGTVHNTGLVDGAILSQFPAANEVQAADAPIYLVVNNHQVTPNMIVFPDLSKMEEDVARNLLKNTFGFAESQIKTTPISNDLEAGRVVNTSPKAGLEVSCDSEVYLFVSNKKEVVKVPDLTGADYDEAKDVLTRLGFTVKEKQDAASLYDRGIVSSVEKAGESLEAGSEVTVYVSQGTGGQ